MSYVAFLLAIIVVGIPGGALMMAGDRRMTDYNVVGHDERKRNARPFYVFGVIWIFIVYAIWLATSIGWVMG